MHLPATPVCGGGGSGDQWPCLGRREPGTLLPIHPATQKKGPDEMLGLQRVSGRLEVPGEVVLGPVMADRSTELASCRGWERPKQPGTMSWTWDQCLGGAVFVPCGDEGPWPVLVLASSFFSCRGCAHTHKLTLMHFPDWSG